MDKGKSKIYNMCWCGVKPMIKFTKLIELPIISLTSGNKIGTIYDVIFMPDNMQIIAFIIVLKKLFAGKKVVLFKDIETVGENAVFIQNDSKMMNITQWHMPEDAKSYRKHVSDVPVYTDNGISIGAVQDALFNFELGVLAEFEISEGFIQDLMDGRKKIPVSESIHMEKGILILDNNKINDVQYSGKGLKRLLSERKY